MDLPVETTPGGWKFATHARPPPDTFNQVRQTASDVLAGSRIRGLLLGRYLMTWQSPGPDKRTASIPPRGH